MGLKMGVAHGEAGRGSRGETSISSGARETMDWVIPNRLAALAVPCNLEDFRVLRDEGIDTLISLTETGPSDPVIREMWTGGHYRFPIMDFSVPSMNLMDRIIKTIGGELKVGRKVAVHCHAGLGRTGLVLACFLVFQGAQPDQAIRQVRAARPGAIETEEQEDFIYRYEDYLRQNR